MDRSPVGVEHGRQVRDLAADEAREHKDDRGERERERADETEVLTVRDQERRKARAERERERQVVQICERDVAEEPRHLAALPRDDRKLALVGRDPTNEPARQVEEDAAGRRPQPDALEERRGRIEVR